MLSADTLATIRTSVLGLAGLVCTLYAILALSTNTPDPMSAWIPGAFGVASAIIIFVAALAAGNKNATMAMDECYRADIRKAAASAFWIGLLLYPLFGIPLSQDWIDWPTAFAAMGTLTGASYLLLFVFFNLRGRQ